MELFGELFIELIFRRIIVGVFGYYTLLAFYKLLNNQRKIAWLKEMTSNEGEEFGKGCLISIVGLVSFSALVAVIVYLFY